MHVNYRLLFHLMLSAVCSAVSSRLGNYQFLIAKRKKEADVIVADDASSVNVIILC